MTTTRTSPLADASGYSLIEMMVAMGITTVVMAATMTGLSDVTKGSEMVLNMTAMNKALRSGWTCWSATAQVGSGCSRPRDPVPRGRVITIGSGPRNELHGVEGDPDISAVLPTRLGPAINAARMPSSRC